MAETGDDIRLIERVDLHRIKNAEVGRMGKHVPQRCAGQVQGQT